jgi:hypothetical protein
MSVVIKIVGDASGEPSEFDGQYLMFYNPDNPEHPYNGIIKAGPHRIAALEFADLIAATRFWQQVNPARPVRPDGKPNRPLSGFTIEFETMPD